jgi:D-tyrosyl-tRNA(Tyr) deacylase
MRILIQRVSTASVRVEGEIVGQIEKGLLCFLGVRDGDTEQELEWLVDKMINLRVFPDAEGKMNLSLVDIAASVLLVSQFTLYADTRKGNRPSFMNAAAPVVAKGLYDLCIDRLSAKLGSQRVATGVFQATMRVELINDGPVTLLLERDPETIPV